LGSICRGDLQERLNFIYRLHLPPALPLSELEDSHTLDDDGGVESCSEVDEAEEVDGSDGIEKDNDGTIMDPLGAGVVVIEGKVTRQSSTDSHRSLETHPPKFESNSAEEMAELSEHFPTKCVDFIKDSDVGTNVRTTGSDVVTNISHDRTSNSGGLTKVSERSTKSSEGSASPSEGSSEAWDRGSAENGNIGSYFIPENEFVDMDLGEAVTTGQQGIYHVVEGSDLTDGVNRNNLGQRSEEDGNDDGNMNQVSNI
jgi:hypothetical protein